MWNSGGGGGGFDGGFGGGGNDGGFMSTQSQFASPAGQMEKKARKSQNLIPVTLRAVMNSDEILRVSKTEVSMMTIVGLIRAVDVTSTKITYTIDDTTATMEAVQWLDNDQDVKDSFSKPLMEMTYCQIFGNMRSHAGKKYIMIFRIMSIEDPNTITTHMLEVIHAGMKLQQIESMPAGGATDTSISATGAMSNSLVGTTGLDGGASTGGGFSGMHGLNPTQNMVFEVIQQCSDESGVDREILYQRLNGKASQMQINSVLEFLSSEGHIYSTIDEDHFKTTDG